MAADKQKEWMKRGATVLPNVLLDHYEALGFSSEQFTLFILLKAEIDRGNTFPSAQFFAEKLGTNDQTIYHLLDKMIKNRLITIESQTTAEGKLEDSFSYDIVWDKLTKLTDEQADEEESEKGALNERSLYRNFEKEFGRPLTPVEMETIGYWISDDHYSLDIIQLALREASLNQAYNFRYIDSILRNWEKKNIKTADDVKRESKKFRENSRKKKQQFSRTKPEVKMDIPLYNWLDNEDKSDK